MYNFRVNTTQFEVVCGEAAQFLKLLVGNSPRGKVYGDKHGLPNTAVFSSDNAYDLLHAMKNNYWDHKSELKDVEEGWTIYILPNASETKELGAFFAIKAVAKGSMFKVNSVDTKWPSSFINDSEALLDKAIEAEGSV